MDRYFVDERNGCIAVRDRDNTDPDYNGLYSDTKGVVKYWAGQSVIHTCPTCGHCKSQGWELSDEAIQEAHALCNSLNHPKPNVKGETQT